MRFRRFVTRHVDVGCDEEFRNHRYRGLCGVVLRRVAWDANDIVGATALLGARVFGDYCLCVVSVVAVPREFRCPIDGARDGRVLDNFLARGVVCAMGLVFVGREDVSAVRLFNELGVVSG